jgi:glycosyltransferase involved in cell wall biosynthesis
MDRFSLYFWDPSVSPHKSALVRHASEMPQVERCVYIAQEPFPQGRQGQGWESASTDGFEVVIAPNARAIDEIVANSPPNAVHIFGGIHWVPVIINGLDSVICRRRRFGIMSEPRVLEGPSGILRLLHSLLSERKVRINVDFVLAIGRHGPRWFRIAGYRSSKIFPFAYFLPVPDRSIGVARFTRQEGPVTIGYLGRLERSKGIELFLDSIPRFNVPISVRVAGAGSYSAAVQAASESALVPFTYSGAITMSSVPEFLSSCDILIAPSITTDDGWGAVVSEALMSGAAVVSSSKVGASVCLGDPRRGLAIDSIDSAKIVTAVETLFSEGFLDDSLRQYRANWAREHLSGRFGASYLLKIILNVYSGRQKPSPFYESESQVTC